MVAILNPFQHNDVICLRREIDGGEVIRSFIVRRDPDGHYYLEGSDDGIRTMFDHGGRVHSLRLPDGVEIVAVNDGT